MAYIIAVLFYNSIVSQMLAGMIMSKVPIPYSINCALLCERV